MKWLEEWKGMQLDLAKGEMLLGSLKECLSDLLSE